MNLVPIPAGEFMMGSPGDSGNFGERPQPLVRITKPFYLGKYKVTQEQWQAVMGNNPSSFKGPQYPVEQVSWDDCQTFIAWLNAKFAPPGKKFALPTEAQWEYACRAGSMAKYCFGDDISQLDDYAWYTKNSDGHSHPVGEKKPNAWGLYDVHGNVWEWCADCYQMAYYAQSPTDDPTGPKGTFLRVYRGSGWASFPGDCRSAARRQTIPGHGYHYLGLRVALVAAASVSAQERPSLNQAPSAKEHGPSGAAAVRNAPSVKGTTWRFPAAAGKTAASTVEFLDGGRFRWGGKPGEGFWKQDGNQITINVNGVTLFQLTLDGDTMRGTWERLAGNDAGQKHTSVLHRATD
jgi:hypothetical protein